MVVLTWHGQVWTFWYVGGGDLCEDDVRDDGFE